MVAVVQIPTHLRLLPARLAGDCVVVIHLTILGSDALPVEAVGALSAQVRQAPEAVLKQRLRASGEGLAEVVHDVIALADHVLVVGVSEADVLDHAHGRLVEARVLHTDLVGRGCE